MNELDDFICEWQCDELPNFYESLVEWIWQDEIAEATEGNL